MPAVVVRPAPATGVAPVAALMAEPARAAMLVAMMDGRALAAGELARMAGVSPATASSHLARLLGGGLVTVVSQGRHRYYQLASHEVGAAIEALSHLAPPEPVRSLRASRQAAALAEARMCYDHLAGRAAVALLDALLAEGLLIPVPAAPAPALAPSGPGADLTTGPQAPVTVFELSEAGSAAFESFGIDVGGLRRARRRFAGPCLDWTQRRPHLNGALGAAVAARLLALGWIERGGSRRAIRVTTAGRDGLAAQFRVDSGSSQAVP